MLCCYTLNQILALPIWHLYWLTYHAEKDSWSSNGVIAVRGSNHSRDMHFHLALAICFRDIVAVWGCLGAGALHTVAQCCYCYKGAKGFFSTGQGENSSSHIAGIKFGVPYTQRMGCALISPPSTKGTNVIAGHQG